jgi:hypothetical protein
MNLEQILGPFAQWTTDDFAIGFRVTNLMLEFELMRRPTAAPDNQTRLWDILNVAITDFGRTEWKLFWRILHWIFVFNHPEVNPVPFEEFIITP